MSQKETKECSDIDAFIGSRVKQRRAELGISQGKLGEQLGVTFQQVQKYENGKNRISASTLFRISRVLYVDLSYFVEGLGKESNVLRENSEAEYSVKSKEIASLVRNFTNISEPGIKKRISSLVKAVSISRELNP